MSTKFAIVNIFGRQYKVSEGDKIQAARTESEVGTSLTFSDIFMTKSGDATKIGAPMVKGASVKATVQAHTRGDKIIVFKYLNKNKLKKTQGHKQPYTVLKIDSIQA